jgi:hypothetical protein
MGWSVLQSKQAEVNRQFVFHFARQCLARKDQVDESDKIYKELKEDKDGE